LPESNQIGDILDKYAVVAPPTRTRLSDYH
jgi:hypothetical protein